MEYLLNPSLIWKNLRFWQKSKPSLNKYIFVVGAPRSGTTLLNTILKAHSQVSGFDNETRVFSYKNRFNRSAYHGHFDQAEWAECFDNAETLVELFDYMHRHHLASSEWVVEKTPQHINHLPYILKHFKNCKVIHIVRDGRDAYCSGKASKFIPQAASLNDYARYWRKCLRSRARIGSSEQRIIDVRYEDLVRAPEKITRQLMEFIGLKFESNQLVRESIQADSRSTQSEFTRLNQEISPKTINRWQTELSTRENEQFWHLCSKELKRWGYSFE